MKQAVEQETFDFENPDQDLKYNSEIYYDDHCAAFRHHLTSFYNDNRLECDFFLKNLITPQLEKVLNLKKQRLLKKGIRQQMNVERFSSPNIQGVKITPLDDDKLLLSEQLDGTVTYLKGNKKIYTEKNQEKGLYQLVKENQQIKINEFALMPDFEVQSVKVIDSTTDASAWRSFVKWTSGIAIVTFLILIPDFFMTGFEDFWSITLGIPIFAALIGLMCTAISYMLIKPIKSVWLSIKESFIGKRTEVEKRKRKEIPYLNLISQKYRNFSIDGFGCNLSNILQTIHYSESVEEIDEFFSHNMNLKSMIEMVRSYKNVIDIDIEKITIENYQPGYQDRITAYVECKLIEEDNGRASTGKENIRLTLVNTEGNWLIESYD